MDRILQCLQLLHKAINTCFPCPLTVPHQLINCTAMLPTPITILLCQLFYSLQMRLSLTVKLFHLLAQKLSGLPLIIAKLLADDRVCLNHFILSHRDHNQECVPLLSQLSSEITSLGPCLVTVLDQTVPLYFTHLISPLVLVNLLLQCNHPCRLLL
jgi:hypothetical protein